MILCFYSVKDKQINKTEDFTKPEVSNEDQSIPSVFKNIISQKNNTNPKKTARVFSPWTVPKSSLSKLRSSSRSER